MQVPIRFSSCLIIIADIYEYQLLVPGLWPGFIDYDWIENKLKPLQPDELQALCLGDIAEVEALIAKHGLRTVHDLLSMVFDGDLQAYYFVVAGAEKT